MAVRQVTDAWQRIETWLRAHAPASYACLKPGASQGEIAALEEALDARVPADLKALWSLHAGVRGRQGAGFLLDNYALMDLDGVVSVYQMKMDSQRHEETLNAIRRAEGRGEDEFTIWKPSWVPVFSFGPTDLIYGIYLDTETGALHRWSNSYEAQDDERRETLITYLEEVADFLETPGLAVGARPGLAGGALVWGPPNHSDPDRLWVEYTG
ncbi:hypothetical protein A8W25_30845 [Streptomyces sp. ERV7]|nr:hypothetical protein A8W25_30845 [Streptomyces sp. ERV7]